MDYKVNFEFSEISFYGVNDQGVIDYDMVREIAKREKPKLIIAGASAYARIIDFINLKTYLLTSLQTVESVLRPTIVAIIRPK